MEYAHRTYNQEDEIKELCVNMGNVGAESNGHGEGKKYSMNLVETINSLKRVVLSFKADNESSMKAKE
jgi:hypothetical protein